MSKSLPGYELLSRGGFGCSSLWLGEDHLLYIEGTGFLFPVHERYRRFSYADIDSMNVEQNYVRPVGAVLLGLVELVAVGCMVAFWSAGGGGTVLGDIGLGVMILALIVAAGLLLRHLVRGAGCVGELVTRSGRVQPRPLRRWHSARKAMARLEERVRAERAGSERPVRGSAEKGAMTPGLPRRSLLICRLAGGISLLLSAVLVAMVYLGQSGKVVGVLLSTLAMLAVSALLISLATISRRQVRVELRLTLWSLLVVFALILVSGLVQFSVLAATRPDLATEMLAFAQMFGRVRDFSADVVVTFFLLLGISGAAISALVLTLTSGMMEPGRREEGEVSTSRDS